MTRHIFNNFALTLTTVVTKLREKVLQQQLNISKSKPLAIFAKSSILDVFRCLIKFLSELGLDL